MVERRRVRAFAAASLAVLAGGSALRTWAPSPLAPRVHVRWAEGLADAERTAVERRFALVEGRQRQETTWEYDLAEPSTALVTALIRDPAVDDTHYIDRQTGRISADAPRGTTRLAGRRAAGWIHSSLFDWFLLLSVSSLVVSSVWLASRSADRH